MVQLIESDIKTREVLEWTGRHVFHFASSSCSQKLRIFLNFKGLSWQSHPIDLAQGENLSPYYLGINPRGLVPTLVEDGAVHIESNDILLHLEKTCPEPPLIPTDRLDEVATLLRHEDELHLDLRTLTFRFMFSPPDTRSALRQQHYGDDTATIQGAPDLAAEQEAVFWSDYQTHGIPDSQARASASRLREALAGVERALSTSRYILGDALSVVDIAWLVYVQRLGLAGYPLAALHPHVAAWHQRLLQEPAVARELAVPDGMRAMIDEKQQSLRETGQTLPMICFPELDATADPL